MKVCWLPPLQCRQIFDRAGCGPRASQTEQNLGSSGVGFVKFPQEHLGFTLGLPLRSLPMASPVLPSLSGRRRSGPCVWPEYGPSFSER